MSFLSILVRLFSAYAFSNYLALIMTNRIIQCGNLILEILELSFSTVQLGQPSVIPPGLVLEAGGTST